jgi:predicted acylesterase/phospholipase RssA
LNGWTESGTRPRFDIVTGVSSGALLSTFAFLGTPADDEAVKDIYTNVTAKDIYVGGISRLIFGQDSMYDTTPLFNLISKHITRETLDRVAAEYDKRRGLYVATANLDHGQIWVWQMGRIAKESGDEALELFRRVLLAAASPPMAFPPQEIGGSLFADASVRVNLLVSGATGRGAERLSTPDNSGGYYVIHNGKFGAQPAAVKRDVFGLLGATVNAAMYGAMGEVLMRSYAIARLHGYEYNLVSIPQDVDIGDNPLAFDTKLMHNGYDAGRAMALKPKPWNNRPPISDEVAPWLLDVVERADQL